MPHCANPNLLPDNACANCLQTQREGSNEPANRSPAVADKSVIGFTATLNLPANRSPAVADKSVIGFTATLNLAYVRGRLDH